MDKEYVKQNAAQTGRCGENFRWYRLNSELYIEGTGCLCGPDRTEWGIDRKQLQEEISHLVIGEGCDLIDIGTFWHWNGLRSIEFPASLTRFGYPEYKETGDCVWIEDETLSLWDVLSECPNLETIKVQEANPCFTVEDGVLFDKNKRKLLACPQSRKGAYTVPEGITEIGECAFADCKELTAILIPDTVTQIEDGAFEECKGLTQLVLPGGVTRIPISAFYGCTGLQSVQIPESVTEIGMNAFYGCTELDLTRIPDTVTTISKNAFYDVPCVIYHGPAQSQDNWGAVCCL